MPQGKMTVLQPGPCALLQDLGRKRLQYLGYSTGGALDSHAFFWANKLLDNDLNSCALEITLGPFAAEFNSNTQIAITGAAAEVFLNEKKYDGWSTLNVRSGDRFHFMPPAQGMRSYLAIKKGFVFNSEFESAAIVMREHSGPNHGKAFGKNQYITYDNTGHTSAPRKSIPYAFIPNYDEDLKVNVLLNSNNMLFSEETLFDFFNQRFCISPRSTRMAYELEGERHILSHKKHLFSHGVALGSIQIPPNSKPLILLNDRQTIGGYPTIGCVTQRDCFALAQRRPGQRITFEKSEVDEAQRQLREFVNFFT